MSSSVLWVDDPLFSQHRAPAEHPERPERLQAARSALTQCPVPISRLDIAARDATDTELARVHEGHYLESLNLAAGKRGYFDADTFYCPASVAAAKRAAGASVELTRELLSRKARFGVALVRPPGHHARPGAAMGFCLLNNVAVAAADAHARGVQRVAILDWDVHHGNGTQEMFWSSPSTLYISVHQRPLYPGTGESDECGTGEGRGFTVNIPLSAGAGDAEYVAAMDQLIAPVIEQYAPDLMLVSAGFDAHRRDPLAQMCVSDAGFALLAGRLLQALGPEVPVGLVLEGGYDLAALSGALASTLGALVEPRGQASKSPAELSPAAKHAAELAQVRKAQAPFWRFS